MPVKLITGDENYDIELCLHGLRKQILTDDFGSISHRVLHTDDMKLIIENIETTPMMFGNLLVEIHTKTLFTRGKTEDEKSLNRLCEDLQNLGEALHVVFVSEFERDSGKKADSAKKLFKLIKQIGEVIEYKAFKPYETDKISDRIIKTAKEKKVIISKNAANLLQQLAGCELRTLDSELEKLQTFIYPEKEITETAVKQICQNNENVFRVLDLWLQNDKYNMLVELNKILSKEPAQKIIALFQTISKRWLRMKLEARQNSPAETAKIIGAHPFFVQKELEKLNRTSKDELVNLRKRLNQAEFDMKTGKTQPNLALETALVL
ncbi:MAG: DNA polymerase III subunit delta [Candidatus Gastranaerophilales bacterium]|nr:DNA polymerase III subunit delta [Candidatus Gastranaerophilales bacterium]